MPRFTKACLPVSVWSAAHTQDDTIQENSLPKHWVEKMLQKTPDRTGEKEREREVRLKKTPKEEKERFLIPLPVEKPLPEGKTGRLVLYGLGLPRRTGCRLALFGRPSTGPETIQELGLDLLAAPGDDPGLAPVLSSCPRREDPIGPLLSSSPRLENGSESPGQGPSTPVTGGLVEELRGSTTSLPSTAT